MSVGSANLEWPEGGGYGGGEVQIGPGDEEVAQSRRNKHSIRQSKQRLVSFVCVWCLGEEREGGEEGRGGVKHMQLSQCSKCYWLTLIGILKAFPWLVTPG